MRPLTPSGLRRTYYLLVALRWLPVGLIVPLMVLVMTQRGLSLGQVGLVSAAYYFTVVLLELPTGGLADALGRRPVLVVGNLCSIGYLGLFLVARDVRTFAAAAVLHGLERALRSGPLEAWFVDAARGLEPGADLRRGLTAGMVAEGSILGIGALAAGLLPQLVTGLPASGEAVLTRLTLPVLAALAVEVLHLVAVWVLLSEVRSAPRPELGRALAGLPAAAGAAVRLVRTEPGIPLLLVAVGTVGLSMSQVETLWQPHFADLLGGVEDNTLAFGVLSAAGFLAAAAGAALAPALARRLGRGAGTAAAVVRVLHGGAIAALAAAGLALPAASAFLTIYVWTGAASPLHAELLHERVPGEQRATMLSVDSLARMAGGLVAGLTLPRLADRAGIPAAWLLAAGLLAASALCYARIRPPAELVGRMAAVPGVSGPRAARPGPR